MKTYFVFVFVAVGWELFYRTGVVPAYKFPGPTAILGSYNESAGLGALATTIRAGGGFMVGVAIAYILLWVGFATRTLGVLDAQFSGARAVPFLAAAPLFTMWFGIGELSRFTVVVLTVSSFVAGPLAECVGQLPREWTIQSQRYKKARSWEFFNVIVPGTLGPAIGPLRIAWAVSFTVAIATDFMGATEGIGRAIESARVTFNTPRIFLLLLGSAAIGVGVDRALVTLIRKVGNWIGRTSKV